MNAVEEMMNGGKYEQAELLAESRWFSLLH